MRKEEIDFVVTWVDGSDPEWIREKEKYMALELGTEANAFDDQTTGDIDVRKERYRDFGMFKYWFRGVEKFAPWVRKVHLVTCGHLPKWLNTDNPKLHIVKHSDFMPNEYLPTFNANPIELMLHKIPGISEKFVYFNDDMYLIRSVKQTDFFIEGKPRDMLAFQPVVANPQSPVMSHMFLNNTLILSKHFQKRENVRNHPGNYFKLGYPPLYFVYNILELAFPKYTGFYTVHNPYPLCKHTFEHIWELEQEALSQTASHRFRCKDDLTLYLVREWQKLSGEFVPKNITKDFGCYELGRDEASLYPVMRRQKKKMICINDANVNINFETVQAKLDDAFSFILPKPSAFEII